MSVFLESYNLKKNETLTLTFLKELIPKKEQTLTRVITLETESNEIAEIISERLLDKVQKAVVI